MGRHRYALVIALVVALVPAAIGQSPLAPESGLLVLRNGQVIHGAVTRAGDLYVVTQGNDVEIRLPATDVEAFCGSIDEAFEFKQRHLAGSGVKPHLDLAEWCLRQNLHSRCAQELVAAMRIAPSDPRLLQLERRLQFAVETPVPPGETLHSTSATVSAEQLEETLRKLPKGSVEKFSANIQPILLNRCAANQCHGPNAQSEFRLLRPPAGQVTSRRFTQRNLFATLKYLDQSDPEASLLVTMPQKRHGTALTAIFDKQSQNQLAELVAWTRLTLHTPRPSPPATISHTESTLSQASVTRTAVASPSPPTAAAEGTAVGPGVQVMRPQLDQPSGEQLPPAAPRFVPCDAYDPEIFNRRYHGGK
jgi:hypothetical protein